jgi:predicted  nucleic acid-binding Zn-ribbon protein
MLPIARLFPFFIAGTIVYVLYQVFKPQIHNFFRGLGFIKDTDEIQGMEIAIEVDKKNLKTLKRKVEDQEELNKLQKEINRKREELLEKRKEFKRLIVK